MRTTCKLVSISLQTQQMNNYCWSYSKEVRPISYIARHGEA